MSRIYDALIVDAVNFAHKTFDTRNDELISISNKEIYKNSVCKFINGIEDLKKKYLDPDNGKVYLLFDNYFSRADLKTAFTFADRKQLNVGYKANRTKDSKEFYQTLNLVRYYYIINKPFYYTLRIENLEADDLVKPLLEFECKDKTCLMVTNDLDWTRYLSDKVDWIPVLKEEPQTAKDLSVEMDFEVNEKSIIVYKALFGDKSDNIPSLIPRNEKNLADFKRIIKEATYPEQLVLMSRGNKDNDCEILKAIAKNESKYVVNVQLVSTIPCSVQYVYENLVQGNNSTKVLEVVRKAIGLDSTKEKFVFGGVRRPRV